VGSFLLHWYEHVEWHTVHAKETSGNYSAAFTPSLRAITDGHWLTAQISCQMSPEETQG